MKFKRKVPYFIVVIIFLIYLAFLVSTSLSTAASVSDDIRELTGNAVVRFSAGVFPADSESISVVLESGETALLDEFEALRSADLSGSTCYDEILAWSASHPDVSVTYTVTFPNGNTYGNGDKAVDLSGLSHEQTTQAITLLSYLPEVSSIDLGSSSTSASPLTADDLSSISSACPDADINYSVSLLGRDYSIKDTSADLTGLTSSGVSDAISSLSFLSNLSSITIGDSATLNGELTWSDISTLAAAFPGASMNYDFTLCGVKASLSDEAIDLSSATAADLETIGDVLSGMSQLKSVTLGNDSGAITLQDAGALMEKCPNAVFNYTFTAFGKEINLSDETLDLNHITMTDDGAEIRSLLPYLKNLKTLDMDSCGLSDETMAQIRDENPNIEVIWRVWFGSDYSVRTNVVKVLASKPSKGGDLTNSNTASLKYLTKVRYLDLGHNDQLSDFSFIEYMPELQIVVISMTSISDLTPFTKCPELLYIEAGNTNISDLSPLSQCTSLKHLNVGTCSGVSDISPLYDIDLLRLWLGIGDPVPQEQVDEMQSRHPDCEINTTVATGLERDENGDVTNEGYTAGNWKQYHQWMDDDWAYYSTYGVFPAQKPIGYFKVVYEAFEYSLGDSSYAFSWNDPALNEHGDDITYAHMGIVDTTQLVTKYEEEDPMLYYEQQG